MSKKAEIIIVDDESSNLVILERILNPLGHTSLFKSGNDMLNHLKTEKLLPTSMI